MIAFKALSVVFLAAHLARVASDPDADADAEPGWTKVLVKKRLQDGYEERSGRSLANTFPFSHVQQTHGGYPQASLGRAASAAAASAHFSPSSDQTPLLVQNPYRARGASPPSASGHPQPFSPFQTARASGHHPLASQPPIPSAGFAFGKSEAFLAQTAAAEAEASRLAAARAAAAHASHLAGRDGGGRGVASLAPGHVNYGEGSFGSPTHSDALSEHRLALEAHEAHVQAHIALMNGGPHEGIAASHLGSSGFLRAGPGPLAPLGHAVTAAPAVRVHPSPLPAAQEYSLAPAPAHLRPTHAHPVHAPSASVPLSPEYALASAPVPVTPEYAPASAPVPVGPDYTPAPVPSPVPLAHALPTPEPVTYSDSVHAIHVPTAPDYAPAPAPAPVPLAHAHPAPVPTTYSDPVHAIHVPAAPDYAPTPAPVPLAHVHPAPIHAPYADPVHAIHAPSHPVAHEHALAPSPAPLVHAHVPAAHTYLPDAPVPAFLGDAPGPEYIPVEIGHIALAGEQCVEKIITVEETESDEQLDCKHSYDKKCHTTYTTDYEPQQEEECEENYKKNCFIEYKKVAHNVTVEFCHTPLVKDCNLEGPVECKTEYEAMCATRFHEHQVVDDIPDCTTVKEYKCRTVQKGYASKQECKDWPVQKCSLRSELVKKVSPETSCEKIPKKMCAPRGCGFVPGLPECFDKTESVVQEVPEETCELNPQKHCKAVTKLVPNLKPVEECVDVPKEICHRSRTNPRRVAKPVLKKWCYTPSEESGLVR